MINLGILGAGGISKTHARVIAQIPERAKVVAIADLDEERLKPFAEEYSIETTTSADELINRDDIDCIVICLPHHLHADFAIKAAKVGKHVFLEKPMAITVEQCDDVIAAVEEAGVKLSVGQSYRYFDGCQEAKRILDSGELGELVFISAAFNKTFMNAKRVGWWLDRNRGGGHWWANGIHALNAVQWLAGSPVVSLKGFSGQRFHPADQMDADDASLAMLQHANNVYSIVEVLGFVKGAKKDQVELTCTEGMMRIVRNKLYVAIDGDWEERTIPLIGDKEREWDAFLSCLENDTEPPIPGSDARESVRVLLAVTESAKTGREVRFD